MLSVMRMAVTLLTGSSESFKLGLKAQQSSKTKMLSSSALEAVGTAIWLALISFKGILEVPSAEAEAKA